MAMDEHYSRTAVLGAHLVTLEVASCRTDVCDAAGHQSHSSSYQADHMTA
jgi:hypothetical protein